MYAYIFLFFGTFTSFFSNLSGSSSTHLPHPCWLHYAVFIWKRAADKSSVLQAFLITMLYSCM